MGIRTLWSWRVKRLENALRLLSNMEGPVKMYELTRELREQLT